MEISGQVQWCFHLETNILVKPLLIDWLNSEQEKYLIKELDSSLHTHTQKEEREKTCMSMQMDV